MQHISAKQYLQQQLANARVCNSIAQLVQCAKSTEEAFIDVAHNYIAVSNDDTASVLYFNNIEEHLDAVLLLYNMAQTHSNLHEMLLINAELFDNKRFMDFVNMHNIEGELF